ncbi:MAG: transketolase [Gemmatimonadales bacterium]|nr:transketolase [Gemmatimonadales bacterium]
MTQNIDDLCINTIRTLSMDAVQKANSGHPGTPMALAPVAYTVWQRFLRFDPQQPIWANRDRFVLSNGHASMLLYSLLHLAGVKQVDEKYDVTGEPAVSLEEIERFRQLGSRTPGHPEYRHTTGVETTTGPLGQGIATSVGMAIAARWKSTYFNRPGFDIFDYDVYAICGDGCLMEGIGSEAASLAGHLELSNLCWLWDNNHITIEGRTDLAFTEDVAARFRAYGWNVLHVPDANDTGAVARALELFREEKGRPTFIVVDSHIAYGAPNKQDTKEAHGEPLGEDEIRLAKQNYGGPVDAKFLVPDGVRARFDEQVGARGREQRVAWEAKFRDYGKQYPDLAEQVELIDRRGLPKGWDSGLPSFPADAKGIAGRDASAKVLNALAKNVPWLLGGSADLAPSTKTRLTFDGSRDFEPDDHGGRNFHFGVREHVMGAVINGMALSKLRPYGSGFLIFSDYARGSIRLSALMEIPVIHIFTHDSISLGEDGPTHQPIEQLAMLRATPNVVVLRPADGTETAEAWRVALGRQDGPSVLVLTRQKLPVFDRAAQGLGAADGVRRGAYVLREPATAPEALLLATGSEVHVALAAADLLAQDGIAARVVSMPSWELFARQPEAYRDAVLPPSVGARVAIEAAAPFGWHRWVGERGTVLAMESFGASAPAERLYQEFGLTPARAADAVRHLLARSPA